MNPQERTHMLAWLKEAIRRMYGNIIENSYPTLVGLPIDDGGDIVSVALDEITLSDSLPTM